MFSQGIIRAILDNGDLTISTPSETTRLGGVRVFDAEVEFPDLEEARVDSITLEISQITPDAQPRIFVDLPLTDVVDYQVLGYPGLLVTAQFNDVVQFEPEGTLPGALPGGTLPGGGFFKGVVAGAHITYHIEWTTPGMNPSFIGRFSARIVAKVGGETTDGMIITASDHATFTIVARPTISVDPALINVGEADGAVAVRVTQSNADDHDTTFTASTWPTRAGASDFTGISGQQFTIPAGKTHYDIMVSITQDAIDESNESFTVTISDATDADIVNATGTVTIQGDDTPVVSIQATASVAENGGTVTFTVSQSSISDVDTVVTLDGSDISATAGSDYVALVAAQVKIPAGSRIALVIVTIRDDSVFEGDETFDVTISSPTNLNGTPALGNATAVVTIKEDDASSTPTVTRTPVPIVPTSTRVPAGQPTPTRTPVPTREPTPTAGPTATPVPLTGIALQLVSALTQEQRQAAVADLVEQLRNDPARQAKR